MITKNLFDEFGRLTPVDIKHQAHKETRRYFNCDQPEIDYSAIYSRLNTYLGADKNFKDNEFEDKAEQILKEIEDNELLNGMLKGVKVPFFIPKNENLNDIGEALEDFYLKKVEASYNDFYPEYEFKNHYRLGLKNKLEVQEGSHYNFLIDRLKKETVVGYFFPCLSEYSIPAAIEASQKLPENFVLSGGFDLSASFIGTPDLLMRKDGYPPLFWLAGLKTDNATHNFHFETYGYNLTFNYRPHLDMAAEYWWCGISVIYKK